MQFEGTPVYRKRERWFLKPVRDRRAESQPLVLAERHARFALLLIEVEPHAQSFSGVVADPAAVGLHGVGAIGKRNDGDICAVCVKAGAVLEPGEAGTVNLSWSGRRDLAVYDTVSLRTAGGSVIGRGRLVHRTG